MAFRYNVNLIRDQIARRRRGENLLRLFTFSLLLFAVLLLITMAVYMARQYQLMTMAREARHIVNLIESRGLDPSQVKALRDENVKFEARLAGLTRAMQSSVPWVETLNMITNCSVENELVLEKVESTLLGPRIQLTIEGLCYAEDGVRKIHNFALMMEKQEFFETGKIAAITSKTEKGEKGDPVEFLRFRYEIPIKHPLGTPEVVVAERGASDGK